MAASVSSPWAFAELLPLGAGLRPCLAASGADRVKREAGEKSAWGGGAGPESWGACPPLPNSLPRNSAAGTRGEGAEGPGWQHSFGELVAAPRVVLLLTLRGRGAGSRSAAVDCCLLPCTTCGLIRARERISCFLDPRKGF